MAFIKNSILKLTIFLSFVLLISCYIDYSPVEHDENLKIEIKEESNSNIVLEDEGGAISFSSYVQYDTIYSLSDRATDIIRGEVLSYRTERQKYLDEDCCIPEKYVFDDYLRLLAKSHKLLGA